MKASEFIVKENLSSSNENSLGLPIAKDNKSIQIFWSWFRGSKIVDAQGRPLVVYHGTSSEFNAFDISKAGAGNDKGMRGKGFYFSPNINTAKNYGNFLMQGYTAIKNPFVPSDFSSEEEISEIIGMPEGTFQFDPASGEFRVYQSHSGLLTSMLKDAGYDGVLYPQRQEVIAFEPSQFRSVDYVENNNMVNEMLINEVTVSQLAPKSKLWTAPVKIKQPNYVGYIDVTVTAPDMVRARQLMRAMYGVQDWEVGSCKEVK